MRALVLLLALAACHGGATNVHALRTCDAAWTANGFSQCEAACVDAQVALGAAGAACDATTADGVAVSCSKTFTFDGVTGCCASNPPKVLFAECP